MGHPELDSDDRSRPYTPRAPTRSPMSRILVPRPASITARFALTLGFLASFWVTRGVTAEVPAWAYPVVAPGAAPIPDDGTVHHVPDSPVGFTRTQFTALAGTVPDWHPAEHPDMPDIVARGRPPTVFACGYCHLPTGTGRPENASIAGLPVNYFRNQMLAFKQGHRSGSEPRRMPQTIMIAIAKAVTDAEVEAAAAYFAGLKPVAFHRILETQRVPKTVIAGWTFKVSDEGGSEELGARILELPEDFERFERRDTRIPYLIHVPWGSLQRGAALAATGGGGRTVACLTCHGPDLRGLADVPRIAGRSPSFLMRQLVDLKLGTRTGGTAELMKPVVANLTEQDMVDLVAYLASLNP